jgi:hypothetical protein
MYVEAEENYDAGQQYGLSSPVTVAGLTRVILCQCVRTHACPLCL